MVRTLAQMEKDPPRRGPKIKIATSWTMPQDVRNLAYRYIRAGIRKHEAIQKNNDRADIGLPPLFEVKS